MVQIGGVSNPTEVHPGSLNAYPFELISYMMALDVLEFTREQSGEAKHLEYRELISPR
jgi:hypothetical protein